MLLPNTVPRSLFHPLCGNMLKIPQAVTGFVVLVVYMTYFPQVLNTISGGGCKGLGWQANEMKKLTLEVVERRGKDLDQIVAIAKAMSL